MIINMTKLFFMIMILISSMITMSSQNWMGMWMGLEINLMMFIPFISKSKNKDSSQAMMIYFLSQSIGSMVLLFSILMNFLLFVFPNMIEDLIMILIMISLMIKVGAAPFHMWLPEMMTNLNWLECSLLMTWQKIAPLTILNNLTPNNKFIYLCVLLSVMVGAIGGVNQTSLRKIMAYSSINHLGWMMMFLSMNNSWYKYWILYLMMILMTCLFFYTKNWYFINQINSMSHSIMEKYTYVMLMLSLGGLPPFLGFLPKWMVIQSMISSNMNILLLIIMLFSLITLFYYMRIVSSMILMYTTVNKWNFYNYPNKIMVLSIFSLNMSLPLFSILSFF